MERDNDFRILGDTGYHNLRFPFCKCAQMVRQRGNGQVLAHDPAGVDGLAQPLADWQARLADHLRDPDWAAFFQARVARLWHLEHAVRNGHSQFRAATVAARQLVAEFVADDPPTQRLAEDLLTLLERTERTSRAAETINSVLRPYRTGRRECTDLVSRQLFLNLFALWFNLHQIARGPRHGQSPYQVAGINLGTDDWLTLVGFPPD